MSKRQSTGSESPSKSMRLTRTAAVTRTDVAPVSGEAPGQAVLLENLVKLVEQASDRKTAAVELCKYYSSKLSAKVAEIEWPSLPRVEDRYKDNFRESFVIQRIVIEIDKHLQHCGLGPLPRKKGGGKHAIKRDVVCKLMMDAIKDKYDGFVAAKTLILNYRAALTDAMTQKEVEKGSNLTDPVSKPEIEGAANSESETIHCDMLDKAVAEKGRLGRELAIALNEVDCVTATNGQLTDTIDELKETIEDLDACLTRTKKSLKDRTTYLRRTIESLEKSQALLLQSNKENAARQQQSNTKKFRKTKVVLEVIYRAPIARHCVS